MSVVATSTTCAVVLERSGESEGSEEEEHRGVIKTEAEGGRAPFPYIHLLVYSSRRI